ncbi:glycoside hydrolase family 3 C-terminal domain-containing protein [Microbacterium sp.]|uniref:glycoside hydrolase family 3 C-terminal domain-containing protein n=1 Tax=Microbacterium sp. TaxID=51671 RepID=UPI003F95163F
MTQISASDLTLEEKAALTSGADFWHTKGVERVGIPSLMLTDGPHGLRKQAGASDHLGLSDSIPATCFPPAVALGSSWDPALAERVGEALGTEAAIENVAVLLGPGINIKRSPLCGRNFEYFSEDPLISGVLSAALVRGIQSQGVGTSLKHFAANNQETDRLRSSSDVDPRPLHEIYLRGFERVVRDEQPWTVMCSYNRLNGVYTSEDPWLLTSVLRDDWGFEGLVVSDWGAVNDRVTGLPAGLDLEMPASGGRTDAQLVQAVRDGVLDEKTLDVAAQRAIDLTEKAAARPAADGPLDVIAHHALAREAAGRSIVLLKNDDVLPLSRDARIAVIGEFARTPRFQGAGSSLINPTRVDSALDEIRALAGGEVTFAPGFAIGAGSSADAAQLRAEAVDAATSTDVVVLFLGLPAQEESEGFDRAHIDLPADQLELLEAVRAANENVVVVLSNGGVVALPFRDDVPAIVEGWLLGQAGGGATADVLFGIVNPAGRLTETVPLRLEDNPSFGNFPGSRGHVRYGEGILVGYRWYDARDLEVAYPFGHGLSYTTFAYGAASAAVAADAGSGSGDVTVTVPVTNTGARDGREVVQVYVSPVSSEVERAPRELKGFASVEIAAGETADVQVNVRRADLAYWDIRVDRWTVEGGDYRVEVGASSRDIRSSTTIEVAGDEVVVPLTMNSSVGEVLAHPVAGPVAKQAMDAMMADLAPMDAAGASMMEGEDAMQKMMASFPIGRIALFTGDASVTDQIEQLIALGNA